MTIFEPLFLLLALTTVVTLVAAVVWAAAGKFARALRVLRRLAVGAAVYCAVVIAVTIGSSRPVYQVGQAQCFDDWCITVAGATRDPDGLRRHL